MAQAFYDLIRCRQERRNQRPSNHQNLQESKLRKKTVSRTLSDAGNWRDDYLSAVVSAEVRRTAVPKPSGKSPADLLDEVRLYASPLLWARAQSGYDQTRRRIEVRTQNSPKKGQPAVVIDKQESLVLAKSDNVPTNLAHKIKALRDMITLQERKLIKLKTELVKLRKLNQK
jgi:hypothetical protein